jgi:hypothetical protein
MEMLGVELAALVSNSNYGGTLLDRGVTSITHGLSRGGKFGAEDSGIEWIVSGTKPNQISDSSTTGPRSPIKHLGRRRRKIR